MGTASGQTTCIDWGLATRPHPGETESGDAALVTEHAHGTLIAVIDGLGHGPEAAFAADSARASIERHAGESLTDVMLACHDALLGSRGCALTLASIDPERNSLEWLAIGNVECALVWPDRLGARRSERVVPRGGVVGYKLPHLLIATHEIVRGASLFFATDGIREVFLGDAVLTDPPGYSSERLLSRHAIATDDALVLVAHYFGGAER
jgi:hypothetical protein